MLLLSYMDQRYITLHLFVNDIFKLKSLNFSDKKTVSHHAMLSSALCESIMLALQLPSVHFYP